MTHVRHNSGEQEWYTPQLYTDAARSVMSGIDLDPCSTAAANVTVKAHSFFEKDDNALEVPWLGRVFMNPPYSRNTMGPFVDKFLVEWNLGHIKQAIVLTNNATDTAYIQRLLSECVVACFVKGRISYWAPGRESKKPLQGQMFSYFGPRWVEFSVEFSRFGTIVSTVKMMRNGLP